MTYSLRPFCIPAFNVLKSLPVSAHQRSYKDPLEIRKAKMFVTEPVITASYVLDKQGHKTNKAAHSNMEVTQPNSTCFNPINNAQDIKFHENRLVKSWRALWTMTS